MRSILRIALIGVVGASLMGLTGVASAQTNRDLRHEIRHLQVRKDRALAHGHPREARRIQERIDGLRAEMHHRW